MKKQAKIVISETFTESTPWLLVIGDDHSPKECLEDKAGFFESPETAKHWLLNTYEWDYNWAHAWNVVTGEEIHDLHD